MSSLWCSFLLASAALFTICSCFQIDEILKFHSSNDKCPCQTTGSRCVSDCTGLSDGDYQSCLCCHGSQAYVTCSNGGLIYRPCPAGLFWDDDKKVCDYSSATCNECDPSPPPPPPGPCPCHSTGSRCVSDCRGLTDGDYQSCRCCHGKQAYVSCVGGGLIYRPCPSGLVWADDKKICNYTSKTCKECARTSVEPKPVSETNTESSSCPCRSTGSRCVSDCTGLPDGDYQSCRCCHGTQAFVKCAGGRLYYFQCPSNLYWADDVKQCNWTTSTCRECDRSEQSEEPKPAPETKPESSTCPCQSTGSNCVGDCAGMPDGDYQSCRCCHGSQAYVTCSNGGLIYRPCPAGLVWDDSKKQCSGSSSSCRECVASVETNEVQASPERSCPCRSTGSRCVSDCTGLPDGDYQSCRCCHGKQAFVKCAGGRLYYFECPANLYWADNVKQCNYTTSTCRECSRSEQDWSKKKWINL